MWLPRGASGKVLVTCVSAVVVGACELEEVTLVEAEDVVVAEVILKSVEGSDGAVGVRAFLHRTLGAAGSGFQPVPGARISIRGEEGRTLELAETQQDRCAETLPVDGDGTCYWSVPGAADWLAPGDRFQIEILLAEGGVLRGATSIPGDFRLAGLEPGSVCRLDADTPWEIHWSPSNGAWAYVNETVIEGLGTALAPEGIEADDSLYLLGLSVSAADTSVVFPGEFGVFNRFELEQDLAVRLQDGLPAGATAQITIAATERNYVNWVRGGNFNPSGQVRIPSLRGDGTGVFGAVLVRKLSVLVGPPGAMAAPDCPIFQ